MNLKEIFLGLENNDRNIVFQIDKYCKIINPDDTYLNTYVEFKKQQVDEYQFWAPDEIDDDSDITWIIKRFKSRNNITRYLRLLVFKNRIVGELNCDLKNNNRYAEFGIGLLKISQGFGYGYQLLNFYINDMRKIGVERINLRVHVNNKIAINLYIKLGFKYYSTSHLKDHHEMYLDL